jgi:hypothetical protein
MISFTASSLTSFFPSLQFCIFTPLMCLSFLFAHCYPSCAARVNYDMSFIILQAAKFRAQCCHECCVPTNYVISWTRSQNDIAYTKKSRTIAFYIYVTAVAQWLRYCATNHKVAGLIPDDVTEFFIDINPSDRTMALGSTQPRTEMSTGSISWG